MQTEIFTKNKNISRTNGGLWMNMRGFSLVELIVALGVFTIVMLIATSAILNMMSVYRATSSSRTIMDNLSFALENIARNMRVGIDYHCGEAGNLTLPNDCAGGGDTFISFIDQFGKRIGFRFNETDGAGFLEISTTCDAAGCYLWQRLTNPEIDVNNFRMFVEGTDSGDQRQPKVRIVLGGIAGIKAKEQIEFNLQTFISQRIPDS